MHCFNKFYIFLIIALLSALSFSLFSRVNNSFDITAGDAIHIMSDKQYRKVSGDYFEAIGSVIINHARNSLYGEKASVSFLTGEVKVISNVRYVGEDMTLHGSSLLYNLKTNYLEVNNARIISNNYILLGKKIIRPAPGIIIADGAEYTTCRDCPESWSIYGDKVHITAGEYIRIKNGYLKINGVVTMYFPYLIFPIKKGRESGLLFPKITFAFDDGATFKQPYFLVLGPYNDATISPGILGKRGWFSEFEYRHNLGFKKWYEFSGIYQLDRIYDPTDLASKEISGHHQHRYFGAYEHHYSFGHKINHHFSYVDLSDLDSVRDYKDFTRSKVRGSEVGAEGFLDFRTNIFNFGVEGSLSRNLLFDYPKEFDDKYVQTLPRFSLGVAPLTLLDSSFFLLPRISVGFNSDYTLFRQKKYEAGGEYIRNADRLNVLPFVDVNFGYLGPVGVSSSVKYDGQFYRFPKDNNRSFSKYGVVYETEFKIEMEKIFGVAYQDEVDASKASKYKDAEEEVESSLFKKKSREREAIADYIIGDLPAVEDSYLSKTVTLSRDAYRHAQTYTLKHYLTTDQSSSGDSDFKEQLSTSSGIFDNVDAIRIHENKLDDLSSKQQMPTYNTIEFKWDNALIRKSAKKMDPTVDGKSLRDSFSYSRIAYFNLSQGYELGREELELSNRLTRLFIESGGTIGKVSLSASDYYFYDNGGHILTLGASYTSQMITVGGDFTYNPFSKDINRNFKLTTTFSPNDIWTLSAAQEYDVDRREFVKYTNGIGYSPLNNCWKVELKHSKAEDGDDEISFNFMINYNEKGFQGTK